MIKPTGMTLGSMIFLRNDVPFSKLTEAVLISVTLGALTKVLMIKAINIMAKQKLNNIENEM